MVCPTAVLFALPLLILTGCAKPQLPAQSSINPDRFYAALLTNNSVYFGKIEGLGTAFPVLRDVYYVQSRVHPETKAVSGILVKRGKEWHGPDRMIIAEKSIVFVEPVGPGSQVAKLISESKQ